MGQRKSYYMQRKHTEKLGNLEKVESYQFFGFQDSTDKKNTIKYAGLTKAQNMSRIT